MEYGSKSNRPMLPCCSHGTERVVGFGPYLTPFLAKLCVVYLSSTAGFLSEVMDAKRVA
jgi:hypothetical protein